MTISLYIYHSSKRDEFCCPNDHVVPHGHHIRPLSLISLDLRYSTYFVVLSPNKDSSVNYRHNDEKKTTVEPIH